MIIVVVYRMVYFIRKIEDSVVQLPRALFFRIQRSFTVSNEKINLIQEGYVLIDRNGTDKSIRIDDTFRDRVMGILEGKVF